MRIRGFAKKDLMSVQRASIPVVTRDDQSAICIQRR